MKKPIHIALANIAEGTHPNGMLTRIAEGKIAKGILCKKGSTDAEVAPCTELTDVALYVSLDTADSGTPVPLAVLGCYTGTVLVQATAEIAIADTISPTGTPVVSGLTCGRALTPAAIGDYTELAHTVCA